jgi:hypothetical protein
MYRRQSLPDTVIATSSAYRSSGSSEEQHAASVLGSLAAARVICSVATIWQLLQWSDLFETLKVRGARRLVVQHRCDGPPRLANATLAAPAGHLPGAAPPLPQPARMGAPSASRPGGRPGHAQLLPAGGPGPGAGPLHTRRQPGHLPPLQLPLLTLRQGAAPGPAVAAVPGRVLRRLGRVRTCCAPPCMCKEDAGCSAALLCAALAAAARRAASRAWA